MSGEKELWPGRQMSLGGHTYVVPALSIGAMRRYRDFIGKSSRGEIAPEDAFDTAVEMVHCAFKRNYPDMTLEQLANLLDLNNFKEVQSAVLNQSGFGPTPGNALAESLQT
jgi:hypothetical protein